MGRQLVGVGSEVVQADVDRDRYDPRPRQGLDGCDEGVRLDQDLVPRVQPSRQDRQVEGVGARSDPAHVPHPEVRRHLGLEAVDLLAAEEVHALEHPLAGPEEFLAVRVVLARQVEQGNVYGRSATGDCLHHSFLNLQEIFRIVTGGGAGSKRVDF